jgi:very-short-patch-repair endonuclease
VEENAIEISVKAGRRIRGALVHRRRAHDDPSVALRAGIPTTGMERTLLDLAAVASAGRVGLALDDALRRRSTTLEAVRDTLSGSRNRPGTRCLRRLLEARDERDSIVESHLESALLRLLRERGVPPPSPQHRVVQGDQLVARLDFAYPSVKLGIEADGYRWHGGRERWMRDLRRENRLKLLGWTILRFSWDDIRERPEMVLSQIHACLSATSLNNSPFR